MNFLYVLVCVLYIEVTEESLFTTLTVCKYIYVANEQNKHLILLLISNTVN